MRFTTTFYRSKCCKLLQSSNEDIETKIGDENKIKIIFVFPLENWDEEAV